MSTACLAAIASCSSAGEGEVLGMRYVCAELASGDSLRPGRRASPPAAATFGPLLVVCMLSAAARCSPAALVEGPFVGPVSSTSAVIWWRLSGPAPVRVVVEPAAPSSGPRREVRAPASATEITVSGLEPATVYRYRLEIGDGGRYPSAGAFQFRTAPAAGRAASYKFAVMCDSRGAAPSQPVSEGVLKRLAADALRRGAQFIVFPGDLVFGYCHKVADYRAQMRAWKRIMSEVMHQLPVYVTMGNHDVLIHRARDSFGPYDLDGARAADGTMVTAEEVFAEEFCNPRNGPDKPEVRGAPPYDETCYSFDWGPDRFVVLNTNYWVGTRTYPHAPGDPCRLYEKGNPEGRIMDRQMAWLRADLASARKSGARHIFIFAHEPAFPAGKHVDDAMHYDGNATLSLKRDVRKRRHELWSLLSRHRVLAAFFGDEHNYSRGLIGPVGNLTYDPPVWHIITGGAGAPLTLVRGLQPGTESLPPSIPHPYRRLDMPWSDCIRVFEVRNHYCLVSVRPSRVSLEVWALPASPHPDAAEGEWELIDRVRDLTVRD